MCSTFKIIEKGKLLVFKQSKWIRVQNNPTFFISGIWRQNGTRYYNQILLPNNRPEIEYLDEYESDFVQTAALLLLENANLPLFMAVLKAKICMNS